jgi:hypothetical protein
MTGEQSRLLKIGDRLLWQNDQADRGTVTETNWAGVTVRWDSRGNQAIQHNDMGSLQRATGKAQRTCETRIPRQFASSPRRRWRGIHPGQERRWRVRLRCDT